VLTANPDVESYSRRLGAEMGMFVTEAYRGDFAVKLNSTASTRPTEVIAACVTPTTRQFPAFRWTFRHSDDVIGRFAVDSRSD